MKKFLLPAALLLLLPACGHAACKASDFSVQNFRVKGAVGHSVGVVGELVNHCATPASAQILVVAKNSAGDVIASKKAWPAGTSNITPGKSLQFNLGRLFRYRPTMERITVAIVNVRAW
ncbi:MAG TPA: hypothetical protein VFJ15_03595 [Oleiagrimonas sp.]|nr:hypothetical protein [Oleiagrimonas sp.]